MAAREMARKFILEATVLHAYTSGKIQGAAETFASSRLRPCRSGMPPIPVSMALGTAIYARFYRYWQRTFSH